ncbi:hypothetical protein OAK75_09660 [Bacteriovoracales bacterium]|nr:hypothetical protein [Bacteriovoracales bacterium]
MKVGRLKAKVVSLEDVTLPERAKMFRLYKRYYANSERDKFQKDLLSKDKVILLHSIKDNELQGFSTLKHVALTLSNGKDVRGIFSGDTIIEKAYWGDKALNMAFSLYLFKEKYKRPFDPLYWFLISKGFKTYLLLANNFPNYYPSVDCETPSEMSEIMDSFSISNFPKAYNKERKTLSFGSGYDHLKSSVAPIDDVLISKNKKVAYFVEKNPNWQVGEELVCLGVFNWKVPAAVVVKIIKNMGRKITKAFGDFSFGFLTRKRS